MTLPLISHPTKNTVMGVFEGNGAEDIFQILSKDGSIAVHMNSTGSIDPPLYPQTITTRITSAQLLAMHTTFAPIISAPAADLAILPQQLVAIYNFGGTAYTVTGGDQLMYGVWEGQASPNLTAPVAVIDVGLIDQSVSGAFIGLAGFALQATPLSQMKGKAFGLTTLDTFTLGNGTVDITLSYVIAAVD